VSGSVEISVILLSSSKPPLSHTTALPSGKETSFSERFFGVIEDGSRRTVYMCI